jgi:hypothetical protein
MCDRRLRGLCGGVSPRLEVGSVCQRCSSEVQVRGICTSYPKAGRSGGRRERMR